MLRSINSMHIASYSRVVKFRPFLPYRKLCRISLVAVFFASDAEDIALLPSGIKLNNFSFCFRAPVFLIQPRNEYPAVDFIATGRRLPRVVRGYRRQSPVSPTFPLKKTVLVVSGRFLRPREIVLSPATGYKHPSGTNSYERWEGRCELPTLFPGYCVKPRDAIIFYHLRPRRLILSFVSEPLRYKVMLLP